MRCRTPLNHLWGTTGNVIVKVFENKKLLFSLRDSLTLLTGSLANFARNICPELGKKGSINHKDILVEMLIKEDFKKDILNYMKMKQDILLLGGVMKKAQNIYWTEYNVDIVNKLTISSLRDSFQSSGGRRGIWVWTFVTNSSHRHGLGRKTRLYPTRLCTFGVHSLSLDYYHHGLGPVERS